MTQQLVHATDAVQLADVLERILDKGVVIAADVRINLLDIELLTINIRLLVASVERAKEMGIDWWEHSPFLTEKAADIELQHALNEKESEVLQLKRELAQITQGGKAKGGGKKHSTRKK